jgi:hypothetical protein
MHIIIIKKIRTTIFKVIKDTVETRWPKIDYFKNILLVIAVPAEFSEKSKAIMRRCAFNAELIKKECSKFTVYYRT